MSKNQSSLPEDADISCPFQVIGTGGIICRGANTESSSTTNKTTPEICYNCAAGKIYREIGCDAFSPEVRIYQHGGGSWIGGHTIFCKKRMRETTFEQCQSCQLVTAATTRELVSTARGLFESQKFYSAYKDIEKARRSLRDGDYEDSITSSISSLESVMKTIHDALGEELPTSVDVTSLWKSTRRVLHFDEIDSSGCTEKLLGTLAGMVSHLGGLRNNLGDAHGRGAATPDVPYALAELAINTASTLSTMILRRFSQVDGVKK